MTGAVLLLVGLFISAIVWAIRATRERQVFDEQFPPISDDEFFSRCKPGTNRQVALRVRRIVAEQLGVQYERIHPTARFIEDLKCD